MNGRISEMVFWYWLIKMFFIWMLAPATGWLVGVCEQAGRGEEVACPSRARTSEISTPPPPPHSQTPGTQWHQTSAIVHWCWAIRNSLELGPEEQFLEHVTCDSNQWLEHRQDHSWPHYFLDLEMKKVWECNRNNFARLLQADEIKLEQYAVHYVSRG